MRTNRFKIECFVQYVVDIIFLVRVLFTFEERVHRKKNHLNIKVV